MNAGASRHARRPGPPARPGPSAPAAIAVAAAIACMAAAATARAAPGRHALVIGANQGDHDEVQLRYAEQDAQRIAAVLRGPGRFFPENVAVMTAVTGQEVRRALIALNARLREAPPGGSVLFVFYSGHATRRRSTSAARACPVRAARSRRRLGGRRAHAGGRLVPLGRHHPRQGRHARRRASRSRVDPATLPGGWPS